MRPVIPYDSEGKNPLWGTWVQSSSPIVEGDKQTSGTFVPRPSHMNYGIHTPALVLNENE